MTLLLGLDIGTTSIKAVLYDSEIGRVLRIASRSTPVAHPQPGWSEHDPQALWNTVAACIREAAAGQQVTAMAISSMAEAGLFLDAGGQAASSIIAWYDRRSEKQAAWIEQNINMTELYQITGQRVSPSFAVTKMLWTRAELPEVYSRVVRWMPVPTYLLWRLTGQTFVDYSIAARTLLFDERTLNWSDALLNMLDLSPTLLPQVAPGGTAVGTIDPKVATEIGLSPSTLCVLGGHDHLCAALATGAHQVGAFSDSSGSANALLMLTRNFMPDVQLGNRGFASYAYVLDGLFTFKGGLKSAGTAVEWLARKLSPPGDDPNYKALETEAKAGIALRAGPVWLPHLIGSGTPQGDRYSRAAVAGMLLEHNRGDLFRGLLESLAFWTRQNLEEMQALTGQQVSSITLTGGLTRLRLLSQLKATVTQKTVEISQIPEAAAAGAILLAGLGSGVFSTPAEAVASLRYSAEIIEPEIDQIDWYRAIYTGAYLPLYQALKTVNHTLEEIQNRLRF